MIDMMGLAVTIPVQPFIASDLGASASQIAMLTGCFSVGQLLGSLIMGKLSDIIGRKNVIILSMAASTASYLLAGFAESLVMLFIARGFCGVCGGTMPVVQAMVLDVVSDPKQRPEMLALVGAAGGSGFVIGPAIGGICAQLFGLSSAFFLCAILGGGGTILALVYVKETSVQGKGEGEASEKPAGGFGMVVWILCLAMFINSCEFALLLDSSTRPSSYVLGSGASSATVLHRSDSLPGVLWRSQLLDHGWNCPD